MKEDKEAKKEQKSDIPTGANQVRIINLKICALLDLDMILVLVS